MGVAAGTFKAIADQFMTDTFAAFKKTLVMRVADEPVIGSPQTYTIEETGDAIPLNLNFSLYQNQSIEIGDFLLFTNASQWTVDPDADNVELVFDGVTLTIINVEKDADNAAYFITVRRK